MMNFTKGEILYKFYNDGRDGSIMKYEVLKVGKKKVLVKALDVQCTDWRWKYPSFFDGKIEKTIRTT